MTRDPIGYWGGDTNLYGYVHGRVVTGLDPSGNVVVLCCTCECSTYTGGPGLGRSYWEEEAKATQAPGEPIGEAGCANACENRSRSGPGGKGRIRCGVKDWKICDSEDSDKCEVPPVADCMAEAIKKAFGDTSTAAIAIYVACAAYAACIPIPPKQRFEAFKGCVLVWNLPLNMQRLEIFWETYTECFDCKN